MQATGKSISEIFLSEVSAVASQARERSEYGLADSLEALEEDPGNESARLAGARCLQKLNRMEEAIGLLADGLGPDASPEAHLHYINLLAICNRTSEAIAAAKKARTYFPFSVPLKWKEALTLPVLYESTLDLERHRERYRAGLEWLTRETRTDTAGDREEALAALAGHTNLYLGYQGRDDRELQTAYGLLAQRIMAASYPQWSHPVGMPAFEAGSGGPCALKNGPIRIGYVSSRFRDLSATRFFLGWIREHDRERFSVYSWHVGAKSDSVTDEVRCSSYAFHHMPCGFEEICRSIRQANLHVLVFLDIGLDPLMTQLACLRLAPVQCMAWDHPVTSGLPTIDYALTSELSEPAGGEAHYSERMLALPGVGVCYRKPAIPISLLRKTRGDFGLRNDSAVYLCCQSVFKFLPENDDVFVRIAQRVPRARFVFLVTNDIVGEDLRRRLVRAFSAAGLDAGNHCVQLPQLKHLDYWNLQMVGDIFLDTIGWSSGGSVFEAVACRLPVVTTAGTLARGRQGSAILTQLGVTDTVGADKSDYVEIAIRLGTDRAWRGEISKRMVRGFPLLYSDTRSVQALERFYLEQVYGSRAGETSGLG